MGEVFKLSSGGMIEGTLLNPNQSPRITYQIRTPAGNIELGKTIVRDVVAFSAELKQYQHFLTKMPKTVQGHAQMAQWCDQNNLPEKRDFHWSEILQLEPDNAEARKMLGYVKFRNKWIIRDEWMRNQGYVRDGGSWRFPQDIKMEESETEHRQNQIEWKKQVRVWVSWLKRGGDRAQVAVTEFKKIQDPYAADSIIEVLQEEPSSEIRQVLVDSISRINTGETTFALTQVAFQDPAPNVRDQAIIALEQRDHTLAVNYLIRKLSSDDNSEINRAASILGRLKHPAAIRPLMDALVTTHRYVENSASDPNRINATFSKDGNTGRVPGMNFGSAKAKVVKRDVANQAVLTALLESTGGEINYQYDERAWKFWYANQQIPQQIDLRRDT